MITTEAKDSFDKYWKTASLGEQTGRSSDLSFFRNADWLQDSAVIDRICYEKGRWLIILIFANPRQASNFIIRFIRSTTSAQKAQVEAQFF